MTELLYLKDSYLKKCEAIVEKTEEKKIVLDKSVFYPEGGGQPTDNGKIIRNGEEFRVLTAKKNSGEIVLEIDRDGLKHGEKVIQEIDWERRHRLMRMHTAAHIVARAISNEFGALITGNQLGEEKSRMDFNVPEFDRERIKSVEKNANEIVNRGLGISIEFLPVEEAMKFPELVRLKDIMPKGLKEWRIVSIGDFDRQADGGTHVKNTKEIGKIKITKLENKGADNRRIYFELE